MPAKSFCEIIHKVRHLSWSPGKFDQLFHIDEAHELASAVDDGQERLLSFLHDFERFLEAGFRVQEIDHFADISDGRLQPASRAASKKFVAPGKSPKFQIVTHQRKYALVAAQQHAGDFAKWKRVGDRGVFRSA